eukprot:CCRYP_007637-RA/>CCRYP_007637-RA protein AED:0.47 eAED:0.47 QI:0/0/0/1/0/0/3/0/256
MNIMKRHKTGKRYLGLTITWDYTLQQVQLSMPGYCKKAGRRFHHPVPTKPQHQPYPHTPSTYGAKQQSTLKTTPHYSPNPTRLLSKKSLGSSFTMHGLWTAPCFLHSCAAELRGNFFLSEDDPSPRNNGAILTLAQIIKPVMFSAAKEELGTLYINSREAVPQQHLLNELGHPQLPLPYKSITPQLLVLSPTSSNPNAPKQWICVSIGSVVVKIKNSFSPISAQEPLTTQTMSQNIIPPFIINPSATFTSPNLRSF